MTRKDDPPETGESLKTSLEKAFGELQDQGRDPDEWLRTLYVVYAERMRADNERIWGTGSIFIPLAVAGFAAFVGIAKPQLWHVGVLGFASTALAVSWLFIAENHRAFQQNSEAWLVAIHELLGIPYGGPKAVGNRLNRILTRRHAIQGMRWVLVCAIALGWIFLFVMFARGRVPTAATNESGGAATYQWQGH